MRFGLTLLFSICFVLTSFGSIDSIYVDNNRNFEQDKIEAYKANPEFSYLHESQVIHWWDGAYEWLVSILSDWFKDKNPSEIGLIIYTFIKVTLWVLLILAIGMLTYSLYKKGIFGVLGRKKHGITLADNYLEDQVLETNWEELINKAINNRQFNRAIRFLFLRLLQSLNNANKIEWKKSKSIRDYQRELDAPYYSDFSSLARYYQYSWFGDVIIDEPHFNEMHKEFMAFNTDFDVE